MMNLTANQPSLSKTLVHLRTANALWHASTPAQVVQIFPALSAIHAAYGADRWAPMPAEPSSDEGVGEFRKRFLDGFGPPVSANILSRSDEITPALVRKRQRDFEKALKYAHRGIITYDAAELLIDGAQACLVKPRPPVSDRSFVAAQILFWTHWPLGAPATTAIESYALKIDSPELALAGIAVYLLSWAMLGASIWLGGPRMKRYATSAWASFRESFPRRAEVEAIVGDSLADDMSFHGQVVGAMAVIEPSLRADPTGRWGER